MASSQQRDPSTPKQPTELNGGYYLLNHLGEEESQVAMLFIVKDAPEEIGAFAKRIGRTADDTTGALGKMADESPAIHLDQNPLPPIELDVRASIREDKKQQLLFDTTGTEFVRAFLVTQIEASTYAMNLSKVLADKETNQSRARVLLKLSAQWQKMRADAFRLLRNY